MNALDNWRGTDKDAPPVLQGIRCAQGGTCSTGSPTKLCELVVQLGEDRLLCVRVRARARVREVCALVSTDQNLGQTWAGNGEIKTYRDHGSRWVDLEVAQAVEIVSLEARSSEKGALAQRISVVRERFAHTPTNVQVHVDRRDVLVVLQGVG